MLIKYDPRNLSRVYLEDREGTFWPIPYRDLSLPPACLWELREAQRRLREQGRRALDEPSLFEAIRQQRRIIEQAQKTSRARPEEREGVGRHHRPKLQIPNRPTPVNPQTCSLRSRGLELSVDLSHLREPYRPTALLTDEEQIRWIQRERWIHYSRAETTLTRLGELLHYPPRDRMPCLLLFGMTGMGKARILQKFLRDHDSHYEESAGRTRLPVASFQMPPAPRERDFYEELLVSLGGVLVDSGLSLTTLRHRVRILAQQLEVRMILIDEIHSILSRTAREQRVILNSVRFLANDLQVPIVCAGTHDAKQALMTDQQAGRFEAMELPAWKDDGAFQNLPSSFAAILGVTGGKLRRGLTTTFAFR